MGIHMKTTIGVSDALFLSAKGFVRQNQTTMRALVEEGLRRVLSDSQPQRRQAFKLVDASVRGTIVLSPDPRQWQQMEEEHIVSRVMKSAQ